MQIALLVARSRRWRAGSCCSLFWLRRRIGLAPLYLVVGAFQYLQLVLAASVRSRCCPASWSSPATAVFFPLTIVVVLLTYIEDDAVETRKVAYGVVIANLAIYALGQVARQHLDLAGINDTLVLPAELREQRRASPWPARSALFVDVVSTVVIFEQVSTLGAPLLFLRLWICLMADHGPRQPCSSRPAASSGSRCSRTCWSSAFVGKAAGRDVLRRARGALCRLRRGARARGRLDLPQGDDVFEWLTYRQRYEQARSLMTRDALTGLFNRGYFDEFGAAPPGPRQPRRTPDEPRDDRRRPPEGPPTTATATRPATSCYASSPRRWSRWCGRPMPPAATAATSSWSCSRPPTRGAARHLLGTPARARHGQSRSRRPRRRGRRPPSRSASPTYPADGMTWRDLRAARRRAALRRQAPGRRAASRPARRAALDASRPRRTARPARASRRTRRRPRGTRRWRSRRRSGRRTRRPAAGGARAAAAAWPWWR